MAKLLASQIRGMLLEQAIAALLKRTGFRIATTHDGDPTLTRTSSGIAIRGRGTDHQIDVIADFPFVAPFTNQPRLLVEAKFTKRTTGVGVVRNTVGVLRDVSEFFLPRKEMVGRRYHYQSAVFSASGFSDRAEEFAFAHDIVLIPLAENAGFAPITEAIGGVTSARAFQESHLRLSDLRRYTIARLLTNAPAVAPVPPLEPVLAGLDDAIATVDSAFLARTRSGFPLFLVPSEPRLATELAATAPEQAMRVRYRRGYGWWLELTDDLEQGRFTFDLPRQLFRVFDRDGRLDRRAAINMKQAEFEEINAFRIGDTGRVETLILRLEQNWADDVRRALAEQ